MRDSGSRSVDVLIVEDSAADAELIARELARKLAKFTWRRVEEMDALERALGDAPDIALVDLTMPSLDGADALRAIRRRCPEVPVIVVTGSLTDEDAALLLELGAADYLLKDRLGRLGSAVARALAARHERERATALIDGQNRILTGIATGKTLEATLAAIVRLVEAQAEGVRCAIMRVDGGRMYTGSAPSLPDAWNRSLHGAPVAPQAGSFGAAAFYGHDVITTDIAEDELWADWRAPALGAGLRAACSRPLRMSDGTVAGTLTLYYGEPRAPSADEYELVECGATLAAIALQKARNDAEQRLAQHVLADMAEGVMLLDAEFRLLDGNRALERILGCRITDLRGTVPDHIVVDDEGVGLAATIMDTIRSLGAWRGELLCRRADGERFPALVNVTTVQDDGAVHYCAVFDDISVSRDYEQRLAYLTRHDPVTNLVNREAFNERLATAIANARRVRCSVGVIVVDLDNFKAVNDSLGHDAGDMLLRTVAARLRDLVRDTDVVARFGGDEFAVLLAEVDSPSDCAEFVERMMASLREPYHLLGHEIYTTCSAGITLYPQDGGANAVLLSNADAAMYRAKQQGRDAYRFFSAEMNAQALDKLLVAAGLRAALQKGEFVLYYQPRFDVRDGSMCGVEALIRWRHPERGLVPPGMFIPVAEETGLIGEIGEWALREACRQGAAWRANGASRISVSVNLSARQLHDPDLVRKVESAIVDAGLPASALGLEITESMLMHDPGIVAGTLAAIAAKGVRVAIDDFGTGYSSLSYLKRFTIHDIKIDRSFVTGLPADDDDRAIVRAIIAVAGSLGLRTVAEGVETDAQRACLAELGCDELQGFLLGHPVPADQVEVDGG